jgi:hypothetical protein
MPSPADPPQDTQCHDRQVLVEFEIATDEYAQETSWDIHDSNGHWLMGDGGYGVNGQTYIYRECLPSHECYVLTVYDEYGDGMDSTGYILKKDGRIVVTGDGRFDSSIRHHFNCANVNDRKSRSVPVFMDFVADDVGNDNQVMMIDFESGDILWNATSLEARSSKRLKATLDTAHCVMLYVIYGDKAALHYDGRKIFDNHVKGVGEIFSFGCGASTKGFP